jgi:cytochrome c553
MRAHSKCLALPLAAALFGLVQAPGAEAASGKALYEEKGCPACHGEDAKTPLQPGFPKVAGQNADYAFNQMKDIKSGARAGGSSEAMKPILDGVSEAEMRQLADYLASLK